MLQMKIYIYYKTLSDRIQIQKSAFKTTIRGQPLSSWSMLEEIIRKTIDEMKILRVKCTPVGIIAKGIDMA